MFIKVVVSVIATLAYVYLLTILFEYCLNEASSTLLTITGALLFILFTGLYVGLLYWIVKRSVLITLFNMISTSLVIGGIIIAALQLFRNLGTGKDSPLFRKILPPVGTIGIFIIAAIANPFVLERVDAGHVGIKVNLTGDNRGVSKYEYKTGWVVFKSWVSKLYEFPTYQPVYPTLIPTNLILSQFKNILL